MPPKSRRRHRKAAKKTAISTSSSGYPRWRQSPIDLDRHFTWTKKYPPLYLDGHWEKEGTAQMTNTGKTVLIELFRETMPTIRGGPLRYGVFEFLNVQFRWGPSNCYGAEHSINKVWYTMEAQAIHWNTRYGFVEKCYERPDGIAIISFLMQVVGCPALDDNRMMARITKHLPAIRQMGATTELPADCLWWMLVEALQAPGYYTYQGSLTVSPYTECVTWIVLPTAIRISSRQMDAFRSLYNNKWENIVQNFRPQQPLRHRKIMYSTPDAVA